MKPSERIQRLHIHTPYNDPSKWDSARITAIIAYLDEAYEQSYKEVSQNLAYFTGVYNEPVGETMNPEKIRSEGQLECTKCKHVNPYITFRQYNCHLGEMHLCAVCSKEYDGMTMDWLNAKNI